MESLAQQSPICLAVCSSAYTKKADNRPTVSGGVAYEVSLLMAIFRGRSRISIIPILKDNPERELPLFLGSAKYIDMETTQWKAEPLTNLVQAIKDLANVK